VNSFACARVNRVRVRHGALLHWRIVHYYVIGPMPYQHSTGTRITLLIRAFLTSVSVC
jgi:hypothetical protein